MKQLFALILPLVITCSKAPDPLPEWVTHSKSNPAYWLGVGTGIDRESAVNNAQNSIAGQISMQIESNMKQYNISLFNDRINKSSFQYFWLQIGCTCSPVIYNFTFNFS